MIYQEIYVSLIVIFFTSIFLSYYLINSVILKYNLFKNISSYKITQDRWGDSNKPHVGGLALSICALLCCSIIILSNTFTIGEITIEYKSFVGLFFVIFLSTAIGIVDEKENIQPFTKTILQLILVSILLWAGFIIPLSNFFYLNIIFSMLWLFFFINATNMFDNVDLSLGIFSITSLITLFIVNFINNGSINISYIILTYIAAIIPFLIFNKYPSKLFMGDIGSLQLGSIIGAISIKVFWNDFTYNNFFDLINALIINNLIFLLIFLDVVIVVFVRMRNKKNPFRGDTNHFAHMSIAFFNSPHMSELFILFLMLSNMFCFFFVTMYSNFNLVVNNVILIIYCLSYISLVIAVYLRGRARFL